MTGNFGRDANHQQKIVCREILKTSISAGRTKIIFIVSSVV